MNHAPGASTERAIEGSRGAATSQFLGSFAIQGMLWMALSSLLFAAMNVLVRLASARVPWSEVAAVRTGVGAAVAIGFAVSRGASLTIHDRRLSWARSIFGTLALLCGFYAMGAPTIALGDAVTLGATSPIFVALLSPWLLGERSGGRVWAATAIAFVGLCLVAGPSFHLAGHVAVIATAGGFFAGMAMIWLRKLSAGSGAAKESPEAIVAHFSLVAAAVTLALALPTLRVPDLATALLLVATGLFGGLAQLAMTRAYALEKAARLGALGYLGIVFAHLFAAVALGERPRAVEAIGAALIIAAGLALALGALREARAR
ncbi:MAG: DMT family transporter [Byssovorax sp.]